jgi:hypothetical protein
VYVTESNDSIAKTNHPPFRDSVEIHRLARHALASTSPLTAPVVIITLSIVTGRCSPNDENDILTIFLIIGINTYIQTTGRPRLQFPQTEKST